MPNVKEAASLIQVYKKGPQIDERMVGAGAVRSDPNKDFLYYTSTVDGYDPVQAFRVYYIDFKGGTIRVLTENTGFITDGAAYFCVRGG